MRASYLMIYIGFAQYNLKSLTQATETLYKAVKMFMTSVETKLGKECKSKGAAFVDYKSDEELDSMLVQDHQRCTQWWCTINQGQVKVQPLYISLERFILQHFFRLLSCYNHALVHKWQRF